MSDGPNPSKRPNVNNFEFYDEQSFADVNQWIASELDGAVKSIGEGQKTEDQKEMLRILDGSKLIDHYRLYPTRTNSQTEFKQSDPEMELEQSDPFLPEPQLRRRYAVSTCPGNAAEWTTFRKQHVLQMQEKAQKQLDEKFKNSSSWLQAAACSISLDEATTDGGKTINACKERYRKKMDAITHLASVSPLKIIPAERAIACFASEIGVAVLDNRTFLSCVENLVRRMGVESEITTQDIVAAFAVLDFNETGVLSHSHWCSAIPLFFSGNVDISAVVFKEIDEDSSGDLSPEEFAKFIRPIVNMIVPPDDLQLREKLKERLVAVIFERIDTGTNGLLNADEFTEWALSNSLASEAFEALEEVVTGKARGSSAEYIR